MQDETDFLIQKECGESSWFGFAVILPKRISGEREKYVRLLAVNGIETRPVAAGNFIRQKSLKYMNYSIAGNLEHADYLHENAFFVGNHSIPMHEKIDLLVNVLK